MKERKILLLLIALIALAGSGCRKENVDVDITANEWYAYKVKGAGESNYARVEEDIRLSFTDVGFLLTLDVNDCGSGYSIVTNGEISFGVMSCTKVCCDSETSELVANTLIESTKYYGKGRKLHFEGNGGVIFLPVKD